MLGGCATPVSSESNTFTMPVSKKEVFSEASTSAQTSIAVKLNSISHAFTLEHVAQKAKNLSKESYQDSQYTLPPGLAKIGYDQWRDIRFKPDQAFWKKENLPFHLHFFLSGFIYNRPVVLNSVEGDSVKEIVFNPDWFDFGSNEIRPEELSSIRFSGFRAHYPLNRKEFYDELVVFLGASYFRALGQGHRYGLSARGIAVDTASAQGEEFPFFKEFWIVRPKPQDAALEVFALMESQSLTGAYRFLITPGKETRMDVDARIFFRKSVQKLGAAALTSMFLFAENEPGQVRVKDFRPEVHDSDGLYIRHFDGERTWRPLVNPEKLFVNSFGADGVQEFGLVQRDAVFDHYQDLEARYELRPSVYIEPKRQSADKGFWDYGRVELVQIPTDMETNDNIVVYWVSSRAFEAGEEAVFSYSMRWASCEKEESILSVESVHAAALDSHRRTLIVDFSRDAGNAADDSGLDADVVLMSEKAHLASKVLFRNEVTGGWRLILNVEREKAEGFQQILPEGETIVELRALLRRNGKPASETLSYAIRY